MVIIPAIDMIDGKAVRLHQGDYGTKKEYGDPVDAAKELADLGATRIHLVDLDAARAKADGSDREQVRNNRRIMERIRSRVPGLLEVGGGIRTREDVVELLERGMDRLILGTLFARQPEVGGQWVEEFGAVFLAGIDARDGEVKIAGWEAGSAIRDIDLARRAKSQGLCGIVYTNIAMDGTLAGPDIQRSIEVARAGDLPLVVSGGVGSNDDIRRVAESQDQGLTAVITGRAYYEGRISLADLFQEFPQPREFRW